MVSSFIGVTGFTRREEVEAALEVFPHDTPRKLMVGVLADRNTLKGQASERGHSHPPVDTIPDIFTDDPRVLNIVHYSVYPNQGTITVGRELKELRKRMGPNLHGFKLNVPWLQPNDDLREVSVGMRMMLVLGREAFGMLAYGPEIVIEWLSLLGTILSDVIVAPTTVRRDGLDIEKIEPLLKVLIREHGTLGIGMGGGLSPENVWERVQPLTKYYPALSIDAQGKLRTEEDDLDRNRVRAYLKASTTLFKEL